MIANVDREQRTAWVRELAHAAGFDLCGVAPVEGLRELQRMPEWLARGYAGEMNYLHDARRTDPALVLDGARSLVVVAINCNAPQPHSTVMEANGDAEPPRGWISRYAWGDDYHDVIQEKLDSLIGEMR